MKAAYYQQCIVGFGKEDPNAILGQLSRAHGFTLELAQRDAWLAQIDILKQALSPSAKGHLLFEFAIPRMGKRADVVIYCEGLIVVVEFKVGAKAFDRQAIEQVHDYAVDLKNFHRGSHDLPIVPILVATAAPIRSLAPLRWDLDQVARPLAVGQNQLQGVLAQMVGQPRANAFPFEQWLHSGYQPTPTIVEAAQALYQQHNVEEIARSDASATNLGVTADCIVEVIDRSKKQGRRANRQVLKTHCLPPITGERYA